MAMNIRAELESARTPPAEAMRAAVGEAAALAPAVIEVVGKAAEGTYLLPRQDRLLFYGVHVLAAARHAGLYRPLLHLLRRPQPELERLFGDACTETVPSIVLSVFDGDPGPLIAVIEDRAVDGLVRWGLLEVLARLTFDGAVARETALAVLDRFDRERLAGDGDPAWEGWQEAVVLLGLGGLADRVRAAWDDGRCPQRDVDKLDWEERLSKACADPADAGRFELSRVERLDDPVAALGWMDAAGRDAEPHGAPESSRRRDPAADIALSDEEIDWLAGFLECAQVPETTMSIEELDGFFAALVTGPELVPPSEYVPALWGTPDGEGPVFDSDEQLEYAFGLLMRHWNAIAGRLAGGYPHVPTVLEGSDGTDWALGFLRGMAVREESWRLLFDDKDSAALLSPVMVLAAPEVATAPKDWARGDISKTLEYLTIATMGLYRYWREREQRVRRAPLRRAPKVGRNEPCPCGSGRKYKHCCGPSAGAMPH